jgi:hypothetical protein
MIARQPAQLFDGDPMRQTIMQAGFRAPWFGEGGCAHDATWTLIGYTENDLAPAFVGQGNAVLHEDGSKW